MSYKLLLTGAVLRVEDGAIIPPSAKNLDWVAYQNWLSLGNVPIPADPLPPPIDFSDTNNLDKVIKTQVLLIRQYVNALQAGTYPAGGKTIANAHDDFMAIYRALP